MDNPKTEELLDALNWAKTAFANWPNDAKAKSLANLDAIAEIVKGKRGRWIASVAGKDVCSNCHKMFSSPPFKSDFYPRKEYKFCPQCGAKMDAKEDV